MSAAGPICIEAVVDDAERPALVAAARRLREAFFAASGSHREIRLRFAPSPTEIEVRESPTVAVVSLLPEVARDESLSSIASRCRAQLSALQQSAALTVFLCTVFRHVARATQEHAPREREKTIERIRRLNLLAAELSHDTGAGVVDIDRAFAHVGARTLQTDYRLGGALATEAAAHTIVWTLLSAGLDDAAAPEILQRAMQSQGPLWHIGGLMSRRLGEHL